jgi:predicted flap endonuclease-1-like 5' DNA nuclease
VSINRRRKEKEKMGNMGLTVEEVNEIQDEMNRIDLDEPVEKIPKEEPKAENEEGKPEEAKPSEEKPKEEAPKEETKKDETGSKAKEEEEDLDDVRELREQLRASQNALKKITGDYQKLNKILIDKGLITEDEAKATEEEEAAAQAAFQARQEKLQEMVSIMEINPDYKDVREVCSQRNFDDVVEAMARFYVKENGGKLPDVIESLEKEVWSEPNPYKRIYTLVKKYHPKYVVKGDTKKVEEDAKKIAEEADKAKPKKAVEANPSAASIGAGGGGTGGGGWTAARIDALPEDELQTVPKDIYDKYLRGELK